MARKIEVQIVGDASSLQRSFATASRSAKGFNRDIGASSRGALAASVSFRGMGRSMAFASAQFLGGAGIVFAFKQVIAEASRVQEETEKTGVVFGQNAAQVQAWSKTLAESFGVSEGAALEAAGRFGNMLRPLGFGTKAAAGMSEKLVQLAADMASFNNTKPDVVLAALSSGLAGQVRPLRQYGVFLSQTRIQQEALSDGIASNAAHLTQAQKVQAAYNIILKDTKLQQGDVARNTGSLSVAQSKFTAGVQDLESQLGANLLPTVTRYVNVADKWLNNTQNQKRIQKDVAEAIRDTTSVVKTFASVAKSASDAVGGFKHLLELLIALKGASIAASWLNPIAKIGIAAKTSRGEVALLRGSLLGLNAISIAPIVIPVAIVAEHKEKAVIQKIFGKTIAKAFDYTEFFATGGVTGSNPIASIAGSGAKNAYVNKPGYGTTNTSGMSNDPMHDAADRRFIPAGGGAAGKSLSHAGLDALSKIQDQVSSARLAVAKGTPNAQRQLVGALKAEIDYDQKYAAIQEALAAKGGKGAKSHADTMRRLLDDEAAAYGEIRAGQAKVESAADKARKKQADAAKAAAAKAAAAAQTFTVPMALLIAQAKAGTTTTTKDDIAVALKIKAFAESVIKSNKKKGQALVDAWNEITNQMSVIGTKAQPTGGFRAASLASLTAGLGLSPAARKMAEARLAQAQAHSGYIPTGQGVLGQPITIQINGAGNPDVVATKVIEKINRKRLHTVTQRRGPNAGYGGPH